MNNTLFFVFISITILSYGIQVPLLFHCARKLDGITTIVYRNMSLAITMLPVLFFAPAGEFAKVPDYLPHLIAASGIGAIGLVLGLTAATYLPMGVAHSMRQASQMLIAVLLGITFLNEYLSSIQLVIAAFIFVGVISLSLSKPSAKHLKKQNVPLGIALAISAGIGAAIAMLIYSFVSRHISPFVAGYFWEVGVGPFAILFGIIRYLWFKQEIPRLPIKDMLKIAAISITTISGTVSYGFAVNYGKYALATTLITTTGFITLIVGRVVLRERLNKKQIGLIVFVISCIMALKFLSQ